MYADLQERYGFSLPDEIIGFADSVSRDIAKPNGFSKAHLFETINLLRNYVSDRITEEDVLNELKDRIISGICSKWTHHVAARIYSIEPDAWCEALRGSRDGLQALIHQYEQSL